MNKFILLFAITFCGLNALAQSDVFDPNEYEDGSDNKKFCTQKVLNQTPTKLFGIGYEHNFGFKSQSIVDAPHQINSMGGLRLNTSLLAISKNNLIVSLGLSSWSSKIRSNYTPTSTSMQQVYANGMDMESFNALVFKPLDEKHFIIAQGNVDVATIDNQGDWAFSKSGMTFYGSVLYGWKKGDYRMWAIGASRTYRLGRTLIVPIVLYNKTFNEEWGVECLFPARAHVRYNFSTNSMLLAGYELEGQQFDLINNSNFLQRGEIKPRLMLEQKLKGFFWLSAQVGYRINGRFNLVNKYDGQEKNEIFINSWGNSPYINIGINFVSP